MDEGIAAGARARELALLLGIGLTTLQRWRRQFAGAGDVVDRRKGSHRYVAHRLSEEERQRILLTCNEPEFAALPPGQIVPILADRGLFIGSERSFYRVLHCHGSGPMGQIRCGAVPGVNYVGGSRQLRRRVGAPNPLPWQGVGRAAVGGWLAGN